MIPDTHQELTMKLKIGRGILITFGISVILFTVLITGAGAVYGSDLNKPPVLEDDVALQKEKSSIKMARASWDTGWFSTEIYKQLLEALGYLVDDPQTMDNLPFYIAAAKGEVDLWVNGWFPSHGRYLQDHRVAGSVEPVGFQVKAGALQGYLIDRSTAEKYNITNLEDFKDTEIAKLFDKDGNGKADLIGCNQGWACGKDVAHHLGAYKLNDTIEQIQGDYAPMMAEAIAKYRQGEPIFFFTWTPNWTTGKLVPGRDVVWIQVPFPSLPQGQTQLEKLSVVENVPGCLANPCTMGFTPSDIRVVANSDFLSQNPMVRRLAELVQIPYEDINAQNAQMVDGEDDHEDIRRHAQKWIEKNRSNVDHWIENASLGQTLPQRATPAKDYPVEATKKPAINVAIKRLEPFVIYQDRRYTGFSVELWEQIADELSINYTLYGVNTTAKLLDEVKRGAADLAIAGIGITSRRERHLDFSHPYFESGLQIMVTKNSETLFGAILNKVWTILLSPGLIYGIAFFLFVVLAAAHIIWLLERKANPQFSKHYLTGIWQSVWWAIVTVTTVGYGDKTPKGWVGRLFGLFWILAGYFVFAYFTASVTTTVALNELRGEINNPDDLYGKKIATIEKSLAAEYLIRQGIDPIKFEDIKPAYSQLEAGYVDAVVYDAPVLQHYARKKGHGRVQVVGKIFQEQSYGIAFQIASPLREKVNIALLKLVENGEYKKIYNKWFGS